MDIDRLIKKFPLDISSQELYNTASNLASRDCPEEAAKIFKFLVNNGDKIPPYFTGPAYFKLGEIEKRQGNKIAAKEYFRRCLQDTPHHFRAAAYLGLHLENIEEWQQLYNKLITESSNIRSDWRPISTLDQNGFDGLIYTEIDIKRLWQNISSQTGAKNVHELFVRFFSYTLSPKPGEEEEPHLLRLEENYRWQKRLYFMRLQSLSISSLKSWIAETALELDHMIQNNSIVEDHLREWREFLFWALCVQLEFIEKITIARQLAEHFFRRFQHSFIMTRQIRHLSLLRMPRVKITAKDRVSIVTPYYNGEQYVEETLQSIANQTYKNFEWIVVNDGSADSSTRALKVIAAKYPGVNTRIINSNHVGQAAATNIGIGAAKGKYILPLDADDQIAVDYLEKAMNQFQEDPSLDVVYFQTVAFGFRNRLMVLTDFDVPGIYIRNLLNICSLVKKEAMERVNGFNENIAGYEDWNMWISFAQLGMRFKRIREVMFFYRKSFVSRGFRSKDKDYLKRKMIMECHPDIYRMPREEEEPLLKQSYLYIPPVFLKENVDKIKEKEG